MDQLFKFYANCCNLLLLYIILLKWLNPFHKKKKKISLEYIENNNIQRKKKVDTTAKKRSPIKKRKRINKRKINFILKFIILLLEFSINLLLFV